jgi:hypothetical protein
MCFFPLLDDSLLSNFLPYISRLDILLPLRTFESATLRLNHEHFHTSIISFLFSVVTKPVSRTDSDGIFQHNMFPLNYFEQLSVTIQDTIGREGPECIQRYLQIVSICKNSSLPLTNIRIRDLGKTIPLFTRHRLFDVLKHREQQQEMKKK